MIESASQIFKEYLKKGKRMKKFFLVILILLLVESTACFALDGRGRPASIGVKAGFHDPAGEYGDVVDVGWTAGLQIKQALTHNISLGGHVAYAAASGDEWYADVDSQLFEFYPFIDLAPIPGDPAEIFFRTGLGFSYWKVDFDVYDHHRNFSDDGVDFMWTAGIGVDFMSHFEFLALYNYVGGDFDGDYATITFGYNF